MRKVKSRFARFHWLKRWWCARTEHEWEEMEDADGAPYGVRCKRCGATVTPARGYVEYGQ